MTRPKGTPGLQTAAVIAGVIAVMYLAREILIPLSFAVTLALILSPAVNFVQKLLMRRFPSALLVMVFAVAVSGTVGYVIFNQLLQVVNELPRYRQNVKNKIKAVSRPNEGSLAKAAQSVKEISKDLAMPEAQARPGRAPTVANPMPVQVIDPPSNGFASVRDLMQPFLGPLAVAAMVLVFTVFLLVEEGDLRNRMFRLAGLSRLNVMTQALGDATRRVSRYLLLQLLVNAGFGLLCGTGLYFIGVPYAALWGTVAGLLRIVPYAGPLVGGSLPLILSLAVFDGWHAPLMVLGLFASVELVTGNFLEPYLYGSHTGISSLALLVTAVFWTVLWGPAGLILSTPLTVCVVVLGRHVPHLAFLHVLLGDEPTLAAEAHFYQRLLALDEVEAHAVAESFRRENSLLALYDGVVLPALTLIEQDRHKGALESGREEFVFLSIREMLAVYSEKPAGDSDVAPEPSPKGIAERVLCIPAHDEADEIASVMLAQLVEQSGSATVSLALGQSPESMLDVLKPTEHDVVVISAVPPFAFSQARTLNRQLRARFPKLRVVIAVWGFSGDVERAIQRFQPATPEKFVTSLAETMQYLGLAEAEAVPAAL